MKIDLSIIVPIYNVEEYLEECLKSIYKLNIKKEIILVNDESPDNSKIIIEKYKELYPEETIVINQKNKGLSGARNSGLERAKGEYISFIDSDDYIDTQKYEQLFEKVKNQNLDIIVGDYLKFENNQIFQGRRVDEQIKKMEIVTGKEYLEKCIRFNSFREEVWDDIFNREFLIKNNLKFKEKLLHEDTLFFIQALAKAKKVKYFDVKFYMYRQRQGSIMSTLKLKNYQHKIYIANEILNYNREWNVEGLHGYLINTLWYIYRNEKYINKNLIREILKKQKKYSIKIWIKIILMLSTKFNYKKIEIIDI
ncbi:glycosyltransferase [Cetobacterium sp. ZWU0022]|uniref:glycosyltransferase n=1 Tax=Cetobacterium sp. ZWU0022 TaxID=1340502 RepID=UPI0006912125|nr:glycosyltransferase [Cetobacterium sp. ZWU0022]